MGKARGLVMKQIVLMSWSDSNIAGDYWKWTITLTVRKNGSYSIGAVKECEDSPRYRLPSIYPLSGGRQVRAAIESLFVDDSLCNEEINWDQIINAVSAHEPTLGVEIQKSFLIDILEQGKEEREFEENKSREKTIDNWVNKAKWSTSDFSHYLAKGMENHKRRQAVFKFVNDYYSKNNRFPTGEYMLSENFRVQFPHD